MIKKKIILLNQVAHIHSRQTRDMFISCREKSFRLTCQPITVHNAFNSPLRDGLAIDKLGFTHTRLHTLGCRDGERTCAHYSMLCHICVKKTVLTLSKGMCCGAGLCTYASALQRCWRNSVQTKQVTVLNSFPFLHGKKLFCVFTVKILLKFDLFFVQDN